MVTKHAATRTFASAAVALGVLLTSMTALAFPPYRSTDADVADPWTLEGRLGLLRVTRNNGENAFTAPLLRLNLGIPRGFELTSEFEYSLTDTSVEDAAIGLKWAPFRNALSFGTEVLALLPVSDEGGAGVQALLLASYRETPLRVHLNGGGFFDARPTPEELGWRASLLAELEIGRARPGLELFTAQVEREPPQVALGGGAIVDARVVDVRAGVHFGLTDASPALRASLWIARAFPLAEADERQ